MARVVRADPPIIPFDCGNTSVGLTPLLRCWCQVASRSGLSEARLLLGSASCPCRWRSHGLWFGHPGQCAKNVLLHKPTIFGGCSLGEREMAGIHFWRDPIAPLCPEISARAIGRPHPEPAVAACDGHRLELQLLLFQFSRPFCLRAKRLGRCQMS